MANVIDHVDIVVRDLSASKELYGAALEPLGFAVVYEGAEAVGFGTRENDDFWIRQGPQPMADRTTGVHLAFVATSNESVDGFFARAMAHGGREDKAPGLRPEFHAGYYAAFVWDSDGNHIEAVNHNR
jgi:catechol 2,3-dioxygenase-like lactoylglutathione lyase family enzyme